MHAVVITGASKGFGKAIAKAIAGSLEAQVHFVLSGRNLLELNEVRHEVYRLRHEHKLAVSCDIVIGDCSNLLELETIADGLFGAANLFKHSTSLASITFFNNAGSLGTLCSVGSPHNNVTDISATLNLNVTACMYLTSEFVRR